MTWGKTSSGQGYIKENAKIAYQFFLGKGYTKEQSAGIVGNLIVESGLDPSISQGGGGPGRGIAQWSAGARWESLRAWASSKGKNAFDLVTQLEFMDYELRTTEASAGKQIRATSSVAAASDAVDKYYERSSGQATAARRSSSQDMFNAFQGVAGAAGNSLSGAIGGVGDTISGAVDALNPLDELAWAKDSLDAGVKKVTDPSFWLRIGFVIFGFVLLLIVFARMVDNSSGESEGGESEGGESEGGESEGEESEGGESEGGTEERMGKRRAPSATMRRAYRDKEKVKGQVRDTSEQAAKSSA